MLSEQGFSRCRLGITSGSPRTRFFCGSRGEPWSLRLLPDLSEAPGLAPPLGAAGALVVSCSLEGWPLHFLHEGEAGCRADQRRPCSSRVSKSQL